MTVSHAAIIGRSHRLKQQNCHDFAITGNPLPGYAFGLVLDGCGGNYRDGKQLIPSHNEVGAKLLGQFAAGWLNEHVAVGKEPAALDNTLDCLFSACVGFMRSVMDLLTFADESERAQFVATRLLTTLVGFVTTPETAVFFWQGDGHLCLNGDVATLDSDNRPDYLAYRVLGEGAGEQRGGGENGRFQSKRIANPADIQWLAVATDGWRPDLLTALATPRSPLILQRWLNVQARQGGNFEDDGAVAVWWRGA